MHKKEKRVTITTQTIKYNLLAAYLSGTRIAHVVPKQIRELQIFIRGDAILRLAQLLQRVTHSEEDLRQVGRRRDLG